MRIIKETKEYKELVDLVEQNKKEHPNYISHRFQVYGGQSIHGSVLHFIFEDQHVIIKDLVDTDIVDNSTIYVKFLDFYKQVINHNKKRQGMENKLKTKVLFKDNLKPVGKVFPSEEVTVFVKEDKNYGGAHEYYFINSLGHQDGKSVYKEDSIVDLSFVKKEESGMVAGLQSEQVLIALIDRHKKLNSKFPSREGSLAITKMEEALMWLEQRVKERLDRCVMGELKK